MKKRRYKKYKNNNCQNQKKCSLGLYIGAVMLGSYLEDIAVNYCEKMRGHIAFGGEYFILPLCMMLAVIFSWAFDVINEKLNKIEMNKQKGKNNENKSV